jgi:outer membrane lipoprotein-sorting protein
MKKFFLILAGLALLPSYAQVSASEAQALLKAASDKMKSYATMSIDFSYKFENTRVDPPIVQNQNGVLAVKGDNYHLSLPGMEQIRNGNKLYNILTDDEEVQITNYEPSEDPGLTPSSILNSFKKGYSYKLGGKETVAGKQIEYVILKPTASEEIDKIMIGIEKATKHLYNMKQWGTNGTVTTLTVKKLKPNPELPAGHFEFKKSDYPGFYIAE